VFELHVDGVPVAAELLGAEVLQAADRPDRLEVALAPGPAGDDDILARRFAAGSIRALLHGVPAFDGRVDRVRWALDARRGRHLVLVAYAHFHSLRAARSRARYDQVTDSDVARRIASELELAAVVDRASRVHAALVRDEDSLVFLRRRARASGFHLAVTAGRLFFTRDVPEEGETASVRAGGCLDLEVVDPSGGEEQGRRGGGMELPGDGRWRPLVPFELRGLAPRADGRYRVVRSLHRLDAEGYRTRVEFLEDGLDLEAWCPGRKA
jgi:hypothetical protein